MHSVQGYLHCACTHLTDFGGVAVPTSADELLAEVTAMTFNYTFALDEAFGKKVSSVSGPHHMQRRVCRHHGS